MTIRLTADAFDALLPTAQLRWTDVLIGITNFEQNATNEDGADLSVYDFIEELHSSLVNQITSLSFTVANVLQPVSTYPIGLRIIGRFEQFSLPFVSGIDYAALLKEILEPLSSLDLTAPTSTDELDVAGRCVFQNGLAYNAMLVASDLSTENGIEVGDWIACRVTQADEEGGHQPRMLVVSVSEDQDRSAVTLMHEPWDARATNYEAPDWWEFEFSSHIQLVEGNQDSIVKFSLSDSEGELIFHTSPIEFQNLVEFLTARGWTFLDNEGLQVEAPLTAATVSNVRQVISNCQPSVQIGPSRTIDGILEGPMNTVGNVVIRGIINGDLNVPHGSDVNVQGIVNGTINISGGTLRLFGTADFIILNGGRLEVHGVVASGIARAHGDVYIDPDSIIGN